MHSCMHVSLIIPIPHSLTGQCVACCTNTFHDENHTKDESWCFSDASKVLVQLPTQLLLPSLFIYLCVYYMLIFILLENCSLPTVNNIVIVFEVMIARYIVVTRHTQLSPNPTN